MAINLRGLRNELLPGLDEIENRIGQDIVAYQEFERDVLVIKAGDQTLELARSEIEDNRYLAKLRFFLGALMCNKVAGSVTAPPPQLPSAIENQFYQAMTTTKAAVRDNLFLAAAFNANVTPSVEPLKSVEPAKPASIPSWPPAPELILD